MRVAMHTQHLNRSIRPVSTLLPSIQCSTTCFPSIKRARTYSTLPRLINKNGLTSWNRRLPTLHSIRAASSFTAADISTDVGIVVEGEPKGISDSEIEALCSSLYSDSKAVVQHAAMVLIQGEDRDSPPGPLELSLVLCDDSHIQDLNREWRGKDAPTDVLSFEMGEGYDDDADEEERMTFTDFEPSSSSGEEQLTSTAKEDEDGEEEEEESSPVTLLGDVVISLDSAARQAKERNHSLYDECRILLVHGVLHLLGYDHENGGAEADEMAEAEAKIMKALGWKGRGLIASSETDANILNAPTPSQINKKVNASSRKPKRTSDIHLLALDMDGTLLDSRSQVLPSSVAAIKAALAAGVTVMLATGKARPAAMAAMQKVGLVGDGLVVGLNNPGLFLQGLAVHGFNGDLIGGGSLSSDIVAAAFQYSLDTSTPICGFLGDECVTIDTMTPEIEELHHKYYEPLAVVAPSVRAVLEACGAGGGGAESSTGSVSSTPTSMKKLLFMTSSDIVSTTLKPYWNTRLLSTDAATMQAVPEMLEVVPRGWNKFVGLEQLLRHATLPIDAVMAIGDGGNDFELVQGCGIGIAMGNAVPEVKKVATEVVASNDDGGIAEAIEKYIL